MQSQFQFLNLFLLRFTTILTYNNNFSYYDQANSVYGHIVIELQMSGLIGYNYND